MTSFINNEPFTTLEMNESRFLNLLEKLIGESKFLQNSPPQGLIPKEDLACEHLLTALSPYTIENGGVLDVKKIGSIFYLIFYC
jgi:acetylornithine deacetylase